MIENDLKTSNIFNKTFVLNKKQLLLADIANSIKISVDLQNDVKH